MADYLIQETRRLQTKHCPVCGVLYAAPEELFAERLKTGSDWYCPNGHSLTFVENEHDRIRRERDQLKQEAARLEDLRIEAYRALKAETAARKKTEGELRRIQKRTSAGVCPCCNRTFAALARHMKTKHPEVVQLPQKKRADVAS